jgi:NCAIR mutase (PurE)-related protein
MDRERLRALLRRVRSGKLGVDEALDTLRVEPVEQLGFATLDLHRAVRRGFPEVVYGPGKTSEQIATIVERLAQAGQTVLVTRVDGAVHAVVRATVPDARYHAVPRAITVRRGRQAAGRPGIVVVTAGTADLPVAEEAALTAELMGQRVERVVDVGVAGIHRLAAHSRILLEARVIVVVAGMEGALPSVVAGLTQCPVIGVPTSTGYGVGRAGETALFAMLSSCAGGLTVVNIDNGFGAGFAAALINRGQAAPRRLGSRPRTRRTPKP